MKTDSVARSAPDFDARGGENEKSMATEPSLKSKTQTDGPLDDLRSLTMKKRLTDAAERSTFGAAREAVAGRYQEKGMPWPIAQVAATARLIGKLGPFANRKLSKVTHETSAEIVPHEEIIKKRAEEKLSRTIRSAKGKLPDFVDEEMPTFPRNTNVAGMRDSVFLTRSRMGSATTEYGQESPAKSQSSEIQSARQKLSSFQNKTAPARRTGAFTEARNSLVMARSRVPTTAPAGLTDEEGNDA